MAPRGARRTGGAAALLPLALLALLAATVGAGGQSPAGDLVSFLMGGEVAAAPDADERLNASGARALVVEGLMPSLSATASRSSTRTSTGTVRLAGRGSRPRALAGWVITRPAACGIRQLRAARRGG